MKRPTTPRSGLSRRKLMKVSAGAAIGAMTVAAAPATLLAADAPKASAAPRHSRRILLKGGTIITMDGTLGNIAKGDLLIDGKKIVAVGGDIHAAGAQVIDASNAILIPGFVDAHRHSWEGQLRRINPNAATLDAYSAATHLSFAKAYRPQDHYVGNYLTALGCIDAGITCMIDNSHNSRSAEHSDAAVEALIDSGMRAVHASGPPGAG